MNLTYSFLNEPDLCQPVLPVSFNTALHSDDLLEFATIDGGVIDLNACEQAVNTGSGIFIGGYFVGGTEYSQCYNQQSFMRS